jgi:diguanylate cyclase (GGDEF)-like protein/PAS domain S-box-containing protein
MGRHPALRDATNLRRRHLQNWDDGRLWSSVYYIRVIALVLLAAASWAVDAGTVALLIVALVVPFTLFVRYRHRSVGTAGWLLPADQYLAAAFLLLDPKVAVGVATCQMVGAVNGAIGADRRAVDRSILAGGVVTLCAAALHQNLTLAVFGPIVTLSALAMCHFVSYIQHRYLSAHHRYEELLDGINAFVVESDLATGRVLYMNRRAREMLGGWQASERSVLGFLHPDDRDIALQRIKEAQESGRPTSFEIRVQRRDGSYTYMEQRVTFSKVATSRRQRSVLIDVTQRKEAERELRHRATHDALTDLPNRRLFRDRLDVALARTARHHRPFAVMIVDLDAFKRINDTLGHEAGDALLVEVAERLTAAVRAVDTVARLGGDEFALLVDETDQHQASVVARRCMDSVCRPMALMGHEVVVEASFGVAIAPDNGDTVDELLRRADAAMYEAKRDGGGYRICPPGDPTPGSGTAVPPSQASVMS